MPEVSLRAALEPSEGTTNKDDSYRFSSSLTVTRTNATVDPSGDSWGSAIQVKRSRSFSVMKRLLCAPGTEASRTMQARAATGMRRTMGELLQMRTLYGGDGGTRASVASVPPAAI